MFALLFGLAVALAGPDALPADATRDELRALRPVPRRLPAREETLADFSAHTLEPGELRVGLGTATVGVAPRLHLGTVPVADVLGVGNAFAKWHVVRLGPLDLGVSGALALHPRRDDGFALLYGSGAGHVSLRVAPAWSFHATVRYHHLDASGIPKPPPFLAGRGTAAPPPVPEGGEAPALRARGFTLQVATDLRFNRRDSLVVRARQVPRFAIEGDLGGWALDGTDGVVKVWDKPATLADPWMVTVAWQLSWRVAQVRLGVGTTSEAALPVVPVADVSLALGGPTRREVARRLAEWRDARRDAPRD